MSSSNIILGILQKKFHHQLDEVSIEEILNAISEMSVELGILQAKADTIKENQKFIQYLLMNRLKDGVQKD